MKKLLLFVMFIGLYYAANAQNTTNGTSEDEMIKFKQSSEAILHRMQSDSEMGKQDSMLILYNAMMVYHPQAKEVEEAKALALKAEKIAAAIGVKLLSPKDATLTNGKVLYVTDSELTERKNALSKVKMRYDEFKQTTWYNLYGFISYRMYLYIGQSDKEQWLRLHLEHTGSDWLFFDEVLVSLDGAILEIQFDKKLNKKNNAVNGRVYEVIDIRVTEELLNHLRLFSDAKEVKVRMSGKYSDTITLTRAEINAMNTMILAYDGLNYGLTKE